LRGILMLNAFFKTLLANNLKESTRYLKRKEITSSELNAKWQEIPKYLTGQE